MNVEVVTAESEEGRRAVENVMRHSYAAEIDSVPPRWARALVVDGVPVSFILVDPNRELEFPAGGMTGDGWVGGVRYAFINDVATREDCRGRGHFRALLEHTFSSLVENEVSLVLVHGEAELYRRFGFDVFTHQSGIFTTPDQIARALGTGIPDDMDRWFIAEESRHVKEDLLLIVDVMADNISECRNALLAAAALAREKGKSRILFEHPFAPSAGSVYPIYETAETPFAAFARSCGATVVTQGADPLSGSIQHADWIKILNPASFLDEAIECTAKPVLLLPETRVGFETEAGSVMIASSFGEIRVGEEIERNATRIKWPSSALAQLVTGYRSAESLAEIHRTSLPEDAMFLLSALFPPQWRFSRNESWTY